MARLGDVCEKVTDYVASGSFAALKENVLITNEEDYAIMVKTADFSNGFTKGLTYTNKHGYDFLRNSNLFGGELILSNIGSIGKVFKVPYLDRPMTLASNTVMIKTTTPELTDYLYYYFLSPAGYKNLLSISSGTSMLKFNKTELKKLDVPVPDIDKQRHIIAVMDKVSELIALRKEQLAKLDRLVKSRFIELFDGKEYPVIPVKDMLIQNTIVEKISNTKAEKFVTVGIKGRGARQRVIKDGKWPVPFSGYRVKQGQFIYSRIDARNGAFAILPKEVDDAVVSKDFPVFDIKTDKILPSVLLFSVLQDHFIGQVQNSSFGATNRQRIQEDIFGEYTITLPPMEIQGKFAIFVEQTDKSKLAIQQSLDKLETLKKSLMQEYFG